MPAAVDSFVARPTRCFQGIEVRQRIDFAHLSDRFACSEFVREKLLSLDAAFEAQGEWQDECEQRSAKWWVQALKAAKGGSPAQRPAGACKLDGPQATWTYVLT